MNKLVLILLSGLTLWGLEFHTYKEGLKIQKQTGKTMMIDIMRTGCHYCENMEKNVLQDKELSSLIEKKFIPVKINLANEKLSNGMHVDFTPTFYFVDKKGKIIRRLPGSWTIEDFKFIAKRTK